MNSFMQRNGTGDCDYWGLFYWDNAIQAPNNIWGAQQASPSANIRAFRGENI